MNDFRRNVYIIIGLILCFTGIFMYKIDSIAKKEFVKVSNPVSQIQVEEKNIISGENLVDNLVEENNTMSIFNYQKNSSWNLMLANRDNYISDNYEPMLENYKGFEVDYRIISNLDNMINDAGKDGVVLTIMSAYRSYDYQKGLYNTEITDWMSLGYNQLDAMKFAAQVVAVPGTSEHQLGLAIDFATRDYNKLEVEFENTDAFKWLNENSYKYGFTMRYPIGKTEITGITYEPWHFRYVGREVATYLKENDLTLEELFNEPVNKN